MIMRLFIYYTYLLNGMSHFMVSEHARP